MSTFGEIVEPGSRTAWEDWDELTDEQNFTELKWEKELESPDEIKTFLILEGNYLAKCIKTQTSNLELVNTVPKVQLELFRSKDSNIYICMIKDYDLVVSSEIVELLRQYLAVSKNVIAIQTKALPEFQTMETNDQDCVIRALSTRKSISLDLKFPKLEQPNIITGVAAGVITLREHQNKSAIALVCFMEHPEEYKVEALDKLLEKLSLSQSFELKRSTVLNSNLYI